MPYSDRKTIVVGVIGAFIMLCSTVRGSDLTQQDLFVNQGQAYPRLPGILVTHEDTVLAAAEWRKDGLSDFGNPTDIVLRRSTDGGVNWSEALTLFDAGSDWIGGLGPIVQDRETGRIFVSFVRIPVEATSENDYFSTMAENWEPFYLISSDDDGQTWSAPYPVAVEMNTSGHYAVPGNCNHGIQLSNGRLVIPSWSMPDEEGTFGNKRAGLIYSDDHGQTWHVGAIAPLYSSESAVALLDQNEIYLNWRNSFSWDSRGWSRSTDEGLSFPINGYHGELVNPTVHAGVTSYETARDGRILVFTNPIGPSRTNMAVRTSTDGGFSWSTPQLIYSESAAYSDVAVLSDGTVFCLYEADSYTRLRLARFSLDWLLPLNSPISDFRSDYVEAMTAGNTTAITNPGQWDYYAVAPGADVTKPANLTLLAWDTAGVGYENATDEHNNGFASATGYNAWPLIGLRNPFAVSLQPADDEMWVHPGKAGNTPSGKTALLARWTAGAGDNGLFNVSGNVRSLATGGSSGDGTSLDILLNGVSWFSTSVAWKDNAGVDFDLSLSLVPGDTLDFLVENGPADDNNNDSTGLSISLDNLSNTKNPFPADGTADISVNAALRWTAGGSEFNPNSGDEHRLYIAAGSSEDVLPVTPTAIVQTQTFDPDLDYKTQYVWRVDEIIDGTLVVGDVWTFTTAEGICDPKLPADTNGDCVIDMIDFMELASTWLDCTLSSGICQ